MWCKQGLRSFTGPSFFCFNTSMFAALMENFADGKGALCGASWAKERGLLTFGICKQLEGDESEVGESARWGRCARDVEHCEQRTWQAKDY
ncbi:hypothetical protein GOP47_0006545 [Adiantum capillus-veneris]|uniref:Uncharacterized protein n=1 Tax=Adiantum capillus-veneris TaxID=13818 RepID=A0A9D4V3H1_ADICA|nr:hypothetical protein GOP47_0006545 [Adiantum capillus-veneris]